MFKPVFSVSWGCLLAVAVVLGCAGRANAEVVVVAGNIKFGPFDVSGGGLADHWAEFPSALLLPLHWDSTVLFKSDPPALSVVGCSLATTQRWYLVEEGDVFSEANIAAGQYPALHAWYGTYLPVVVGMDDFYLGVTATRVYTDSAQFDIYGWIKIGQSPQGLTQLGDAIAYRDPPFRGNEGIIVGTTTIVPEPATWVMLVMAWIVGGGWWAVKKRNSPL